MMGMSTCPRPLFLKNLEMAVARTTPHLRPFLTHPAHLMGTLPTLGGVVQVREIQVVHVQRGA